MGCAAPAEDDSYADEEWLPEDAHYDDECPVLPDSITGLTAGEALTVLHHQAHGTGALRLCRQVPCRGLDIGQLRALGV